MTFDAEKVASAGLYAELSSEMFALFAAQARQQVKPVVTPVQDEAPRPNRNPEPRKKNEPTKNEPAQNVSVTETEAELQSA